MPAKKPSAALLTRAKADATPQPSKKQLDNIVGLTAKLRNDRLSRTLLETQLAKLNEIIRNTEEVLIPAAMDAAGMSSFVLADGTSIKIETQYHPNVLAKDKPALMAWLRKNGFSGLIKNELRLDFGKGDDAQAEKIKKMLDKSGFAYAIKTDVHPQTFRAFVRERIEANANLPKIVDPNPVRTTKVKEGEF
jgi:hypothetical protein